MNKRYFLTVAIVGLLIMVAIMFAMMGKTFLDVVSIKVSAYEKYIGFVPVLAGVIATIATAMYFDRSSKRINWVYKVFICPVVIYLSGVVAGVGVNFLVNGLPSNNPMAYLRGPLLLLTIYGVPCALVIGTLCFFAFKLLKRTT